MQFRVTTTIATLLLLAACSTDETRQPVQGGQDDDAGEESLSFAPKVHGGRPLPSNEDAALRLEVDAGHLATKKPYWRIYKRDDLATPGLCYLMPRPDAQPSAIAECAKASETGKLLEKYDLCESVVSDPEVINSITCDDAKIVSQFLHANLKFSDGTPYLYSEDSASACQVAQCKNDQRLADYCSWHTSRANTPADQPMITLARLDTAEEMKLISACANEIYGIK